jgi:hypothetical protein
MVWDVMVAAAFVVVSVAVLVCFLVKFFLTWLKKPHQVASQHCLLSITPCAKVQYKLKIAGHKLKARQTATTLRDLSGGRYDTGR